MSDETRLPIISIPGADAFNAAMAAWKEAIERSLKISVSGALQLQRGATGFQVLAYPSERNVELTSDGGSGSYNWTEVFPSASGHWTVYPSALTGVAWEFNRTTGLLGSISPFYTKVKWYPTSSGGEWRFRAGICATVMPMVPLSEWYQPLWDPTTMQSSAAVAADALSITSDGNGLALQNLIAP